MKHFCGINWQIILRRQNPSFILKIKFGNGRVGRALIVSALKCSYVKKKICYNIFLDIIINVNTIIYFFVNVFIQTCHY